MIISASYRTDIPTFYGEWFSNRLRAGYCKTVNPYSGRVGRVSLLPNDVDGFVFWTKNVGPFIHRLSEVERLGVPFVVQHTINAYPRELERSVIDAERSVEHVRRIAERFGPRVCVWRYDTILESSLTPRDFHLKSFARLAAVLEGATDEVVISFAQGYKKTLRNVTTAAKEFGFAWSDPDAEWKRTLACELAGIAAQHRIRLTICSQPEFLNVGMGEARRIDAQRLSDVRGRPIRAKVKGNRPGCHCAELRDIGDYDTCPHGCVYCYAVRNPRLALRRFRNHDADCEFLFPPSARGSDKAVNKPYPKRMPLSLLEGTAEA